MNIKLAVAALLFAALSACGVYLLKYEVRQLEGELAALQRAIADERRRLQVLRADWAYLTRPERLARQAEQLDLAPALPDQIVTLSSIPARSHLELSARPWPALLPSGQEVTLRLKPVLAERRLRNGGHR